MTVSRDFVVSAFLEHLGRQPESEKTITHYMACGSRAEVVRILTRSAEYFRKKFSGVKFDENAAKKILLIGNCQVAVIKKLMESMSSKVSVVSIGIESANIHGLQSGNLNIGRYVEECDTIIFQVLPGDALHSRLNELYSSISSKAKYMPSITYTAFHPDMGYIVTADGGHLGGPMGEYHSKLAFWAWQSGFSVQEAVKLYRYDVYDFLGYFAHAQSAERYLLDLGNKMELNLQSSFARWKSIGCFMHSINHPKLFVLADLARLVLDREGVDYMSGVEDYLFDDLSGHPCWPIYPEIGQALGLRGAYEFKQSRHHGTAERPVPVLTLEKYVELAYETYNSNRSNGIKPLVKMEVFDKLASYVSSSGNTLPSDKRFGGNPYSKLKSYQFWRKGIVAQHPSNVDPVVRSSLKLDKNSKVATAGSCFAQHISRTLSNNGFTYYVAEAGDGLLLEKDELARLNYGVFSARYGNIYTSRQLVQLFDRAYGRFTPIDSAWERKDGRFVDPFRPLVYPEGYASPDEVKTAQLVHYKVSAP